MGGNSGGDTALPIIKARPLAIKKQPTSDHPKLKAVNFVGSGQNGAGGSSSVNASVNVNVGGVNNNANSGIHIGVSGVNNNGNSGVHVSINRRIEMPPAFLFPETEAPPADLVSSSSSSSSSLSEASSTTFSSATPLPLSSVSVASSGTTGNLNLGVSSDEVDRALVEPRSGNELENNDLATRKVGVGEENNGQQKEDVLVDALNNINATTEEQQDLAGELARFTFTCHLPYAVTYETQMCTCCTGMEMWCFGLECVDVTKVCFAVGLNGYAFIANKVYCCEADYATQNLKLFLPCFDK